MLRFLFVAYDERWEVQLNAVQAVLACCLTTIESNCKSNPEAPEEDPLEAVAALYQMQPQGKASQLAIAGARHGLLQHLVKA